MELKKRELYRVIVFEPAKTRILNNQCPACGLSKEKWTRRTDWRCCSVKCTEKYQKMYVAYGWRDFRERAFKRDNYTCVKCGDNRKEVEVISKQKRIKNMNGFLSGKEKIEYEYYDYPYNTSNLIADHIIPIALGGDEWDLNNIQTLCRKCNSKKTSDDLKKINLARKNQKTLT